MTLKLPVPVVHRLDRSPLSLVVCQVKVEENLRLAEPRFALQLKERLQARYPKVSRLVGPRAQLIQQGGVQVEQLNLDRPRGHRLTSAADDWHITLDSESFSLETTAYTIWPDFLARLQDLLTIVSTETEPVLEARLGLRYVNLVRGTRLAGRKFRELTDFEGFIAPWLCGPLVVPALGSASQDIDGRTVFSLGEGCILNARYGTVRTPDEELSFLLDFDAYRDGGQSFSPSDLVVTLEKFNATITALFEASFTPAGLDRLLEGGEKK